GFPPFPYTPLFRSDPLCRCPAPPAGGVSCRWRSTELATGLYGHAELTAVTGDREGRRAGPAEPPAGGRGTKGRGTDRGRSSLPSLAAARGGSGAPRGARSRRHRGGVAGRA